jgi:hypothetical protein
MLLMSASVRGLARGLALGLVLGLMMVASAPVQADNAHYNLPSSVCFRGCMKQPPNCWDNDTRAVCPAQERRCGRKCHYSLAR